MGKSLGPSPGVVRYSEHQLNISGNPGRWSARVNGVVVADSHKTLVLDETNYGRVVYFPPQDVMTGQLTASDSSTTCPFKGEAKYFAAEIDGKTRDVAWHYPAVYDEVSEIEGHIAFYADRVDVGQEPAND